MKNVVERWRIKSAYAIPIFSGWFVFFCFCFDFCFCLFGLMVFFFLSFFSFKEFDRPGLRSFSVLQLAVVNHLSAVLAIFTFKVFGLSI